MTFFCPTCWKEIKGVDTICPFCGADISAYANKDFEGKLINALRHTERETVQRAVYVLGRRKSIKAIQPFLKLFKQTNNTLLKIRILYDMKSNIPLEFKAEILKRASLIKDRIKIISKIFDLAKEHREVVHEIFGKLPHCLEIVEDAKAKRLKRYGDVSNGLDNILDPQLNIITDLILEMQYHLR